RRHRDERADQPELRATLELTRALVDVVHVEHRDALEAVGKWLAELRDPVVVHAADRGEHGAVRDAIPEEALARLQTRAPYAVHLVLFDHRVGTVRAEADAVPGAEAVDLRGLREPLTRLDHRAQGSRRLYLA